MKAEFINRPFAASRSRGTHPPCWRARGALGQYKRGAHTSLRKFGNLSIREKLGYDVSVRPNGDRTDSGEGKRSQESARRWDEHVVA